MTMRAKAQKWGNSLAVRIPKAIAEQARLREEDDLEIDVETDVIRLTPLRRELTLDQLLERMTDANRHDETSYGRAQGSEAW